MMKWFSKRCSLKKSKVKDLEEDKNTDKPEQSQIVVTEASKKLETSHSKKERIIPAPYKNKEWSTATPIPYKPISSDDVSYGQVNDVMTSWAKVQLIPNYLDVAGEILLRK